MKKFIFFSLLLPLTLASSSFAQESIDETVDPCEVDEEMYLAGAEYDDCLECLFPDWMLSDANVYADEENDPENPDSVDENLEMSSSPWNGEVQLQGGDLILASDKSPTIVDYLNKHNKNNKNKKYVRRPNHKYSHTRDSQTVYRKTYENKKTFSKGYANVPKDALKNFDAYNKTGKKLRGAFVPVPGYKLLSKIGDRRPGGRRHQGVDLGASRGTPIHSLWDGVVIRIKNGGLGGKTIKIKNVNGIDAYYAHLNGWAVREGQHVARGQVIGYVGNTGDARRGPPHLHLELHAGGRLLNPLNYL